MSDTKTCAELVNEMKLGRNTSLEEIQDILGEDDQDAIEEALSELNNLALDIETYKVVKILLSTGGPADWIEVKIDEHGDVRSMEYHYADWFDHASTKIYSDEYLWDYAMQIVQNEM